MHPRRTLCYYFKKDHDALDRHVAAGIGMSALVYAHALTVNDAGNHVTNQTCAGNISFDTALELEVEHCTAERPAMSLRASVKNGTEINRYDYLFSMMLVQ